ncbi:MAG: hypothetical protein WC821_01680 [archaeon]|jgi:hypothetical protein
MGYLCSRIVKTKKYYYLEESFLFNGKLTKESVYLGSLSPSNDELFLAQEVLSRTCLEKNHVVLVPPLTEFIRNRTASILEQAKNKNKEKNSLLNQKQLKEFKKNERELFFKNIFLKENPLQNTSSLSPNKFKSCFSFYDKELSENKSISIGLIHKIHSLLFKKKKENSNSEALLHLILKWYSEKDNLIHPVEFAAKFYLKFLSINPFENEFENEIVGIILMNYVLEQKGFSFVIISKKRKIITKKH